ncbi:MAG: YgfZ/GcvT domain-containing protein, partial [Actinomycetota bacterium]
LSPTGRIRADLTVAATSVGTLLIQDPVQPTAIDRLLDPYVLSSGVDLADVTGQRGLLAFPGAEPPRSERDEVLRPSCLGPGADLLLPERRMAAGGDDLDGLVEVGPAALESWRIERGAARLGVDLGADSLPHEAGLDHAVAYRKGCFLGQEAVARVRNLGHPPFVVLAARARGPLARGEGVTADGGQAGTVTSVSPLGQGRSAAIVRVRWAARDATLRTDGDTVLETIGLASGIA